MNMIRRIVRIAAFGAVCMAGGYAGFLWSQTIDRGMHGAILGAGTALAALAGGLALQVLSKLDRLLDGADKFEIKAFVAPTYSYISDIRLRLVYAMMGAGICGVLTTGISVLLLKSEPMSLRQLGIASAVGYGSITFVLLFALRVIGLYLALDGFRRELFLAVEREKMRESELVALSETRADLIAGSEAESNPGAGRNRARATRPPQLAH